MEEEKKKSEEGEEEGGDDEYSAPLMYVTDDKQSERLDNPASPCIMKLENDQRKDGTTPNLWTTMNTIQLSVRVR